MIVMIAVIHRARRNQKRQNHTRRRLTTSSSRSFRLSEPKRLGHGIARRVPMSTRPRKVMMSTNVRSSDFQIP